MIIDLLLVIAGLVLLAKGGDLFVDSSVQIAQRFHIPKIVIGGTIVSLATTSPELVVSTMASVMHDPGIALGNAVGSAIANIGLIVGLTACIAPVQVDVVDFRRRSLWMIFSAVLVIVFSWSLLVTRMEGLILLLMGLAYLLFDYFSIQKRAALKDGTTGSDPKEPVKKAVFLFITGAVLVIIGSRLIVIGAISIAEKLGIPSIIVGLTVVAVGTSLPELVTAIISSRKGMAELSVGNIIGANVLNLAMITGASGVIYPLTLSAETRIYSFSFLILMIGFMALFFWRKGQVSRKNGVVFLSIYSLYIAGLIYLSFR